MTKPIFPHAVDSTMLATFRSCPQKFFRQYVEHWKPKAESVHLVAGGAFAYKFDFITVSDVVDKIQQAATDPADRPVDDIKIISAKVVE